MVKGVSRQIIMVDSPERSMFEKAIFIIKDGQCGASCEELLRQAQLIAENYLRGNTSRVRKKVPPVLYTAIGAAITGAVWLIVRLI